MSERLPYEEQLAQQWTDLPLPDENMAWADMKRRLEKDNDDGIIAWWRRGCALWALLLLVLISIGWWLLKPEKWFNSKSKQQELFVKQQYDSTVDKKNENTDNVTGTDINIREKNENNSSVSKNNDSIKINESISGNKKTGSNIRTTIQPEVKLKSITTNRYKNKTNSEKKTVSAENQRGKLKTDKPILTDNNKQTLTKGSDSLKNNIDKPVISPADSAITKVKNDSLKKTIKSEDTTSGKSIARQDSSKKKAIFFSAGIAMNQQLPIAGQKATPYNSLGRKGSLADYIPSIYFRLNKKDKWFIQFEFRYGAPQYTKELLYQQKIVTDSAGPAGFSTTTSSRLKKTFYHQLPVTFNYFILPNWSLGTGFVWNKFSSAISEQEVIKRNNATLVDSLVSKGIIKDKNDSVFAKSYFQAVFETQYKWKRFSMGARYAFGLQPYIKFTLPGGVQQQEKNSSLQIFLRYEIWRSKTKK